MIADQAHVPNLAQSLAVRFNHVVSAGADARVTTRPGRELAAKASGLDEYVGIQNVVTRIRNGQLDVVRLVGDIYAPKYAQPIGCLGEVPQRLPVGFVHEAAQVFREKVHIRHRGLEVCVTDGLFHENR